MIWTLSLSHGFPIRTPTLRGRDVEYRVFESIQPVFIIVMPAFLLYGIIKARGELLFGIRGVVRSANFMQRRLKSNGIERVKKCETMLYI